MQPALIDDAVLAPTAPGWGLLAIGTVVALLLTVSVRRASRAPALQRWARWFNPIIVAIWLAVGWLATKRALSAESLGQMAARVVLLVAVLAIAAPLLRDLLAAVMISFEGRHRIGDDVRVAGLEGRVIELGLRSVVVRRRDGSECGIPNSRFMAAEVVRLNLPSGEAPLEFEVAIAPGRDVEHARHEVVQAALLSPFAAPGSLPEVFVVATEGPQLRLRVRAYVFDRLYEERYRSDILARLARPG
jgi:small-conductance mechanosensitive channel